MASQQSESDSMILVDKPFLTTDAAARLISRLYGVSKPTAVKQLDGYDSQNFLVKTKECHINGSSCSNNDNDTAQSYILKVMSTEESKDVACLQAIHSIQRYLNEQGYSCMAPLVNIHGEDMRLEKFTDEQPKANHQQPSCKVYGLFMVRAYPFMPGTTFDVAMPSNSTQLFYEAGKSQANFHRILQSFPKDTECLKKKSDTFQWSLNMMSMVKDVMDTAITDNKRRHLVSDIVDTFQTRVMAKKDQLRKGIIHGDFNHTNILLSPSSTKSPGTNNTCQISGVIDFDDCQHTCLVFDIGISMAYVSLAKSAKDKPHHASAAFLAGYQSVSPLTAAELEVLHVCQAARYIQSLVFGLYTYVQQPGNEYLLETQIAWPILERFWEMDVGEIHKMWRDVTETCVEFDDKGTS